MAAIQDGRLNTRPLCIVGGAKATAQTKETCARIGSGGLHAALAALYWNFVWSANLKLGAGVSDSQGRLSEATDR